MRADPPIDDRDVMTVAPNRFDLAVIGSGPAGQKAAVQAAKLGRSVVVIERDSSVGGECIHHGTIPSKALRETAVAVTSLRKRCGAGIELSINHELSIAG